MTIKKFLKEHGTFCLILTIASTILLSFAYLTIGTNVRNRENLIELETSRSLNQYNLTLNEVFSKIEIIETFVVTQGMDNITDESFNDFVSSQTFNNVGFVSFSIAPDGIIGFYHSDDYGEGLIGLDLVNDEREFVSEAVEYAIENKVVIVNGPFDLLQGNKGIVFRKPIFVDNEFKGLINFVVDYAVLSENFNKYKSNTIESGVYDENKNIIFGEYPYTENVHVYEKIDLEYVDWSIGIQVSEEYERSDVLVNSFLGIGFTLLLVVMIVLLVYFYLKNKAQIKYQNQLIYYDNLTLLPNRRLFELQTAKLIKNDVPFFLGFGDLDNFKNINDVLGHSIGDKYLSFVASHLETLQTKNLRIYRWGGDEFIFVFLNTKKEDLNSTLDYIFNIFKTPFEVKETKHQISISMGIVEYPSDGLNIDELVKRADIVMYDIKSQYKNSYSFFEQKYLTELYAQIEFQQVIETYDISDFELFLQPVVDVKTNEIRGFEALSRLFDETGKSIPIHEVIKLYEQDGTITKLDKYVFKTVCEYIKECKRENSETYFFTFNISPLSLTLEFVDYLEETISGYDFRPEKIVIEIIETLGFKDVKISIELLERIKSIGFKIAMDDFGMGYSSLSYIAKLPLDLIKVDRSFVQNYETNDFNRTILHTIKDISNSLDLDILVEGIETKEQLAYITDLGSKYYQGYIHSKPMSFKDIKELLAKNSKE